MGGPSTDHLARYKFKPGQVANPAGRPKGSRSKLQELTLALLHEDFSIHGQEVIERVRARKPEVYLAAVVSLLPKQAEKIPSPFSDISDQELEQLEQYLAAIRAKTVQQLDLQPSKLQSDLKPSLPDQNSMPRSNGKNSSSSAATKEPQKDNPT